MAPTISLDYYPANWQSSRDGATPLVMIVHDTESPNGDSRRYLQRGGSRADGSDRKVSIHALIRNGIIYRMVDDSRVANHAGGELRNGVYSSSFTVNGKTYRGAQVNRYSLGVELEHIPGSPFYSDADLYALGWLLGYWRTQFGPLPALRHATVDPTRRSDPVGLSTEQIEAWVVRATADPFARWGTIGRPDGAAQGFAIPRAWLMNQALGACVAAETYSASGEYSIAEFEHGLIAYYKRRNAAIVELF